MKVSAVIAALLAGSASAFVPSTSQGMSSSLKVSL